MEQMNSKLSVRFEYRDVNRVKQAQEISISSEYSDSFNPYQVTEFIFNVIRLTGHSTRDVLLTLVESSNYVDDITDDLNYLGYGNKEEE